MADEFDSVVKFEGLGMKRLYYFGERTGNENCSCYPDDVGSGGRSALWRRHRATPTDAGPGAARGLDPRPGA